jgi:MarR family 2-MHQ and catechol resistance regulon transcriptional repressor
MSTVGTKTKDRTTAPQLWVVLARAYGSLAAYVEQVVAQEGICLSDFMVLEVLLHKGNMTISGIGQKVLLAAPSMTSAIDRLEKLGYVVRKSSNEDRRIRLVELTSQGHTFITELYQRHARSLELIAGALNQTEKENLRESLKKLGLAAAAHVEGKPDQSLRNKL